MTLRGDRMWEFFDRLLSVAIPRIRDFRGLPALSWDGRGNYTFGLNDQTVFPEINVDKIDTQRGMDITIVTTAISDEPAARRCSTRSASRSRRASKPRLPLTSVSVDATAVARSSPAPRRSDEVGERRRWPRKH